MISLPAPSRAFASDNAAGVHPAVMAALVEANTGHALAYGEDRDTAIARMKNALSEMVIEGIKTNIPLHQEIFNHAAFKAGGLDIHYLERRLGIK